MENANKKQTNKIDWKKKGLGWIPDYPDLRDYQLDHKDIQKNGRLKREAVTNAIENLSENIIEILNTLQNYLKKENQSNNEQPIEDEKQPIEPVIANIINEITNQAFGGITFVNVRLHRFLREQRQEQKASLISIDSQRKNELVKLIFELKNYLIILVLKNLLKLPRKDNPIENQIAFKNLDLDKVKLALDKFDLWEKPTPDKIVIWLRTEEFDPITKFLVMQFQQGSGILVDGIVGLETYTTLNEYFRKSDDVEKLKACIEQPQQKTSFSPKTRLVSIPSLISDKLLIVILNELKISSVKQIRQEVKDNQKLFEVDFLKGIGVEEDCDIFATLMGKHFKNFDETQAETFLDDILKAYGLSTPESFALIFYNEFFVVEPLVSFVVKIMSPLAHWKHLPLEKAVTDAIKEANKLFHKAFCNDDKLTNIRTSQDASNTDAMFNTVGMERLAREALQQVTQLFGDGIKLSLQEKQNDKNKNDKKQNEINSTLCFYFIVKKFLNEFIPIRKPDEVIQERQANIFDKQELFELKKLPDEKQPKTDTELELFPTPELQIPVTNNLITSFLSRGLIEQNIPKPYLFLPSVVDLSYWDSAVEDQGALQSCTAFAAISLIEYFANRSRGKSTDLSPLFLYKAARNLMSLHGDVGASVRETMKAMALFGVPPEQYWTYEEDKVDEEPPPFCYSYAQNFQSLKYFRLDYADMPTEVLLSQIKAVLAAGFPCMFGFSVYTSAYQTCNLDKGYIPFPSMEKDRVVGGHAVVAVGYDDLQTIPRADRTSVSRGAFLIRNSWGTVWGREGYGWIPYDYILQGLTRDWWSLLKSEWFDEDSYGLGARNIGGEHNKRGQ
ncbi:MAG: C1 family peptidase [Cyanobacteriota bacterium]